MSIINRETRADGGTMLSCRIHERIAGWTQVVSDGRAYAIRSYGHNRSEVKFRESLKAAQAALDDMLVTSGTACGCPFN